jgi:Leucine-rich repeat (LRR) protein
MAPSAHRDVFRDVVNDLMKELHALSLGTSTIYLLLVNNVNSPVLAEIEELSLTRLDANQVSTLPPVLAKLTGLISLGLPLCPVTPDHLNFIFMECPALSNLQSLNLCGAEVMSEELLVLSRSTTLTNLTSLNLSGCKSNTSRVAASKVNRSIAVALGKAAQDSTGLVAFLSSPVVRHLTHLDLTYTHTRDPLVHAIATSPFLSNLTSLKLSANDITLAAVSALASSTTLSNLTHLNLSNNYHLWGVDSSADYPPSLCPIPQKLRSLNLSHTHMDASSLRLLPKGSPHLTELRLKGNRNLGPAAVTWVSAHLPNLTKLDLTV